MQNIFKNNYLTTGNLTGNFVFRNCPKAKIEEVQQLLTDENEHTLPCNIKITRRNEESLEKIFTKCVDDNQKRIIARDFLLSLFMSKLLVWKRIKGLKSVYVAELLLPGFEAYDNADYDKCREYVMSAPNPIDITCELVRFGKIELNIFLIDTKNLYIAQAVNNFLASRNKFGLRVITTNDNLTTMYDQCGNLVQPVHDYTSIDISKFLLEEQNEN